MLTEETKNEIIGLESFVQELSKFSDSFSEFSFFQSLVRCSFIKNYEFLKLVYVDKPDNYFFLTSSLRSIVEDIIVLESVHCFPSEKREKLLKGIQLLEVKERILKQWDFFQAYRPFQPVIDKGYSFDEAKSDVQSIGKKNVWPNFGVRPKKLMPPTTDMAQKLAPGILYILYEFIYRLSSGTVHFSPQTLLRMSWGNVDKDNSISGTISVNHMNNYHKAFCQIYGTLLFSFFFEFFPDEIGVTSEQQTVLVKIRKALMDEMRWPEMITFEEMNIPVPNIYNDQILLNGILHQGITEMLQNGFVKNNYKKFIDSIKCTN